jgi:meckelin
VKLFKELLDAAVSFAEIGVAYLIQWQTNYDIFFLDWERPRTSSAPNGKMDASPVSAWRKMFIANEWNEIQSRRVTSRELTLLLMVLFLEGLNGRNLAIIEPSMGTDDPAPYQVSSALLRFAVAAGLMVVIVACQTAYKIVFHHNYVEHPVQQFVDLLGMANLSIVILDDECAGYYLHGRSLMTFADTSMAELTAQMRKEQEMQVSARGLVPAAHREDLAENQCFELFITKELRMAYESKLLRRIEENDAMRGAGGLGGAVGTVMGGGRAGRGGRGGGGFMTTGGRDGGFRGGGGGGWEGQRGGGAGGLRGGGGGGGGRTAGRRPAHERRRPGPHPRGGGGDRGHLQAAHQLHGGQRRVLRARAAVHGQAHEHAPGERVHDAGRLAHLLPRHADVLPAHPVLRHRVAPHDIRSARVHRHR